MTTVVQTFAIDSLLSVVTRMSDDQETQMTLLACALVIACHTNGVDRDQFIEALSGMFDDARLDMQRTLH